MPKFTYEEHQERMRRILAQPTPRPNVLGSLLERVRGRVGARAPIAPSPRLPKLPRRIERGFR